MEAILLHDIEARPRIQEIPDDIGNAVLQLIQGRKKMSAITREELVYHVPLLVDRAEERKVDWDREIRKAIMRLRKTAEGCLIVAQTHPGGYWWATEKEHLDENYRQLRQHAATMFINAREQLRLGYEQFQIEKAGENGQLSLFG